MHDLQHLMAAYFHQDWWEEYDGSWLAALADYVDRAPERVSGLVANISMLLSGDPTEEEVATALEKIGQLSLRWKPPTAHIDWLRDILSEVHDVERSAEE